MSLTRNVTGPVGTPAAPVTPADLTAFAARPASSGAAAGDPQPWVDAAVGYVQGHCGRILATDMRVPAWHDGRRGTIVLPACPAISTLAELHAPDGTDVVADLKTGDVDWEAAIIRLPRHDAGEWVARVTTATTTERTAALTQAALIIGAHLWGSRGPGAPGQAAPGYAIPHRASELMAPYLLSVA